MTVSNRYWAIAARVLDILGLLGVVSIWIALMTALVSRPELGGWLIWLLLLTHLWLALRLAEAEIDAFQSWWRDEE